MGACRVGTDSMNEIRFTSMNINMERYRYFSVKKKHHSVNWVTV